MEAAGLREARQTGCHGVEQLLAAELAGGHTREQRGLHHRLLAEDGQQAAADLELVKQGLGCLGERAADLLHEVDDAGRIASAQIVPPMSQNQAAIEDDLLTAAREVLALLPVQARRRRRRKARRPAPVPSIIQVEGSGTGWVSNAVATNKFAAPPEPGAVTALQ